MVQAIRFWSAVVLVPGNVTGVTFVQDHEPLRPLLFQRRLSVASLDSAMSPPLALLRKLMLLPLQSRKVPPAAAVPQPCAVNAVPVWTTAVMLDPACGRLTAPALLNVIMFAAVQPIPVLHQPKFRFPEASSTADQICRVPKVTVPLPEGCR